MRKLIFALIITLFALPQVMMGEEEYWLDINFTRDKADFPELATAGNWDIEKYSLTATINAFPINTSKINVNDETETFVNAVRMSRNVAQHMTFAPYSNIGTLKIHYFNASTTYDAVVPLLYNSGTIEEPIWSNFDPAIEMLVKKNDDASTTTRYFEIPLNLTDATQLRLGANLPSVSTTPNVLLYAVQITKMGEVTGTALHGFDTMHFNLSGRILEITGISSDYDATVFDLAGVRIGDFSNGKTFVFQNPGIYMVKIKTTGKFIARKVLVL